MAHARHQRKIERYIKCKAHCCLFRAASLTTMKLKIVNHYQSFQQGKTHKIQAEMVILAASNQKVCV